MRFKFVFVVLLVGIFTINCGGGTQLSPTAPSTTVPVQEPAPPQTFSFMSVSGGGSSWDLPVWALRGDNSEDLVKQMVFCSPDGGASYSPNVQFRTLSRLVGPTTIVVENRENFSDIEYAKIESAARYMESITGLQMAVDTKVVVGNRVGLKVDPNMDPLGQIAIYSPRGGGPITTADISIKMINKSLDYVLRHELGHLLGLCHHNFSGIMGIGSQTASIQNFAPAELDNAVLMYKLPVTTPFPGERSSTSSSLSLGTSSSQKIVIED